MRNPIVIAVMLITLILVTHSITLHAFNNVEPRVIVYGIEYCHSCISFKNFLDNNGFDYEYRDLTNETYSREYLEITMLITNSSELSINDIVVPLTIIYDLNGYPVAIIIGDIEDRGLIEDLMSKIYNGIILIVTETKVFELRSYSLVDKLRQLIGLHGSNDVVSPLNFIPLMLGLALADSINPCAISTTVLLVITSAAIGFIGKKKYLPVTSFVIGVYLGYLLLGFLVSYIISLFNILLFIVLGLALAIILKDVIELARGKYRGIECTDRDCLPSFISKLPMQIIPIALAGFGMIISWTFMSCSAAPYFIFLSYITIYVNNVFSRMLYLMIYCLIIILPLIIVAVMPIEKVLGLRKIGRIILIKDILLTIIVIYIIYNILLSMGII